MKVSCSLVAVVAAAVSTVAAGCSFEPPVGGSDVDLPADSAPVDTRAPRPTDSEDGETSGAETADGTDATGPADSDSADTEEVDTDEVDTEPGSGDAEADDTAEMEGPDADTGESEEEEGGEQFCHDGLDGDGDGRADCRDADCDRDPCGAILLASGPKCCAVGPENQTCSRDACE